MNSTLYSTEYFAIPALCIVLLARAVLAWKNEPPGPKGLPFLGNLLDIPAKRQWLKFSQWRQEYGDVVRLSILGRPFLVLNSRAAVNALLVNKSADYSDRPSMTMLKAWAGWTWSLPGLHYGSEMALHRRLLSSGLSLSACKAYHADLQMSSLRLANIAARNPGVWDSCVHTTVAGNILKMTYGYTVQKSGDPWIGRAERILHLIQDLGTLGSHPVDVFPWMAILPPWIFGRKLAHNLAELRGLLRSVFHEPYNIVKHDLDKDIDRPCFASAMITAHLRADGSVEHEHAIKGVAATNYTVGVETVESSLRTFALAMMLNPEVQTRARSEIDAVLGGERFPSASDRASMPYVEATMLEVLRWQPATPLAVAHRTTKDDTYAGLWIARGTVVIPNSWECLHDPTDYPAPHEFRPERFLATPAPPDPRDFAFGYGRRACPGRAFAEASLFTTIATLLAVCTFALPAGVAAPDMEYESGVAVSFPKPYKCDIAFRSQAARELLEFTLGDLESVEA